MDRYCIGDDEVLVRDQEGWRIEFDGMRVPLGDEEGFLMLAAEGLVDDPWWDDEDDGEDDD